MTVVDADTGEVLSGDLVASNAATRPVISTPGAPMTVLEIANQCRTVEVWAETCGSIDELKDAGNKLAAIGEYLERTSIDGRARVVEAQRRLDVRVGELLGPATVGSHSSASEGASLTANDRSQTRKMADHPDIVEAVINDSTDESPASRRKVMDEINRAKHAEPAPPTADELKVIERAEAIDHAARRLRKVVGSFDQLVTLSSHPLRDEILEHLPAPVRTQVLNLEKELFG